MNNIILQCINLNKSYQNGKLNYNILNNISFSLKRGSIAAIIGPSGVGKSSLLHILGGLDQPTSGDVLFNGQSLMTMSENQIAKIRNTQLGFVYQFHHLLLDFNVLENVAMPLLISKKNMNESKKIAYEMLKKFNLENKITKYPSELSGGEKQRVSIARAFINNPSLIIADEPTGSLDSYNSNIVINLIFQLNKNLNTTFLIVTHDSLFVQKIPVVFKMTNQRLFNYRN
ncbi:MAG: lipoprotein-releasing ABC transporter ATP-binding protein LolD [Buchnera aphidicola (Pentalonia nigronervosa)]|jgi:lipoprotein-releasing system ATP-binding protein|uniref:Lipoprotein-releasing system ATP-binding protein LolD n=1 Tax=Buchnera aphidicola (Pentalonia nigronervosa) TaxID=1309793 RepID=A0A7H1AZT0_9GAMM|nr:MAG: lipoprotein-releasing ABC transporter ATP-binding protein LolD [Buchnera aphidicola (Pentalonia nigronervosa)]